jgi:hypothetical protein
MDFWKNSRDDLPVVDEIVEVCVSFGQGGATQLRGYRLAARAGGQSLWLNALTHEPFPEGWRVARWKRAEGELVRLGVTGFTGVAAKTPARA